MKIKEILADVFLLQFSQSEVVDGNAVKKKQQRAAPAKPQPCLLDGKAATLELAGDPGRGLLCFG